MLSSIIFSAAFFLCVPSSRNYFGWGDMPIGTSVSWYGLASGLLLIRYYQGILSRLSYLMLLIYWYVYVSGGGASQHFRFSQILLELCRSRYASSGERDELGRHWTINLAVFFISTALDELLEYFFFDWMYSRILFHVVLNLFVFGHGAVQLFLRKQISWIVRLNRAIYKWRDYGLECLCHAIGHQLKSRATRVLIYPWWWTCYRVYRNLTPELLFQISKCYLILNLICKSLYGVAGPALFSRTISWIIFYLFWLRELARFSNPDPPVYEYSKLKRPDHIRLVLLHPRFGFRQISCSMVEGPHMQLLFYEAISYTWGNPDRTEEILVNGCKMKVTRSVYEILATFSSQFIPQLLWIDAICIDQDNDLEKAQQVPMMDTIYSNALFTTVFLGQAPLCEVQTKEGGEMLPYQFDGVRPPDQQTHKNVETARLTFDLFNEFHILQSPIQFMNKDMHETYDFLSPFASNPRQWTALVALLQHPWFSRVWVVQEVALSPAVKLRSGDEIIDWKIIANALKMIHNMRHFRLWLEWSHGVQIRRTQHSNLYNVIRMDNLRKCLWPPGRYDHRTKISITQVLRQSLHFTATDPRDQVYGLVSLCDEKDLLKVDYDAPVEKVYLGAATELVRKKSFGLLFGSAGIGNRSESGHDALRLPSWIPNWRDAPKCNQIGQQDEDNFAYHRKIRWQKLQPPQPAVTLIGDRILRMSATLVDTVADVGPTIFDVKDSKQSDGVMNEMCRLWISYERCREFLSWSPFISEPYAHAASHQSLLDAFHHSLLTNRSPDPFDSKFDLTDWVRDLHYFRHQPNISSSADREIIHKILQSMDSLTEKIESYCGGRRLFVGNKGWIGLCPPGTEKRDGIWAVQGLNDPIVLRKVGQDTDNQYKLVGDCHCQGLKVDGVIPSIGILETIDVI